jgi:hypothetical protein
MRAGHLVTALLISMPTTAQVATPTGHWGGIMLPELETRTENGLHFVGFTQYGKEMFPGTRTYTFTPYNEINETLGFNFITRTDSRIVPKRSSARTALTSRRTWMFGIVDDRVTEFLQNDAIHWANFREDSLERVPRRLTDTPTRTSLGPSKGLRDPIFGFSQEYFLRLQNTRRFGGREETVPTPFFVGAGIALSTINHEMFLQAGSNVLEVDLRPRSANNPTRFTPSIPGVLALRTVGIGGMVRSGVLLPASHFDDLTASYTNVQGVTRFGLEIFRIPVNAELAATSASGFFVRTRTAEELAIAREIGSDPKDVYESKTPLREWFVALRVRAGGFTFETYNDMIGGKDKGPSFGAHVNFEVSNLGFRR